MNLYKFSCLFLLLLLLSCSEKNANKFSNFSQNQDSIQLKETLKQTLLLIDTNQNDSAFIQGIKLKKLAHQTSNNFYLGKAHSVLGYLNLIKNKEDSAYQHFNDSKEYFYVIKDSLNLAKVLGNMAMIQSNQGDYSGSEVVATEALTYIKNKKNIPFLNSIYNCLAISSDAKMNYKEAIYWFQKSIDIAQDSLHKKTYLNNIAVSYTSLKEFDKAISILTKILKDPSIKDHPNLLAKVKDNLAFTQWKKNPSENKEKEFMEALLLRESIQDELGQIASHSHLTEYFGNAHPTKSLQHAQSMYAIATKLNSSSDRMKALEFLIHFDLPINSKKYAKIYSKLNDSLVTVGNQNKDQFAKIRFDSEKNREDNQVLRAETAEQKLEIEERKLHGILLIAGILVLMGAALTYQRIQKIKNEKRIVEEIFKTETKLARKVHDDLSNTIYQLMSSLETHKNEAFKEDREIVIDKLEEIYKLSRDISRENQTIETGKNYPDEILNLVASYKNDHTNIILSGFNESDWLVVQKEVKIQFYKTLQELLTNMKKHSKASLVVLSFQFEKNKLEFFYTDNGVGIKENELISKNGLLITETRIEKIKGAISFVLNQSAGLRVTISIPL